MKIAVLGAGESGVGAALLAQEKGLEVFVSDAGKIKADYKQQLQSKGIPNEEGKHTWTSIFDADEIVKSPGIPDNSPLIRQLADLGKPIISEIEFAGRYTTAPIIGITGSNGKTTTTRLIHHLFQAQGLNAALGGNVGHSFARNIIEKKYDYFVLELSSFQLDGIVSFRPDVAILLNITPDHLDRYEYKMENYVRSKFRIAMNQRPEDLLILNGDNEEMQHYLKINSLAPRMVEVLNGENAAESWSSDKITTGTTTARFDFSQSQLRGPHNVFNATCAIIAAKQFGVSDEAIQRGLNTFVNAPHRLELAGNVDGVEYINDSKATNVDSVFYALQAMEKPVVWIAGGQDKGNDYRQIEALVRQKVKALVCLGADNRKLIEAFSPILKNITEAMTAAEAVEQARKFADSGDVVLLSPACASFDLFENFARRGELFKEAIQQLT